MLDYKDIIIKHYALHMSGRQIAAAIGASKSGVNDFLKAFEQCESLSYPPHSHRGRFLQRHRKLQKAF